MKITLGQLREIIAEAVSSKKCGKEFARHSADGLTSTTCTRKKNHKGPCKKLDYKVSKPYKPL